MGDLSRGIAVLAYTNKAIEMAVKVTGGLSLMKHACDGCSVFESHGNDISKDADDLIDAIVKLKELFEGKKES